MRVFCNEQNVYYIQTEYIICSYNNFIIQKRRLLAMYFCISE
mgnify:FL=1